MVALYKYPSSGQNINGQRQEVKNQTNLRDLFLQEKPRTNIPLCVYTSLLCLKKKRILESYLNKMASIRRKKAHSLPATTLISCISLSNRKSYRQLQQHLLGILRSSLSTDDVFTTPAKPRFWSCYSAML